VAGGVFNSGRIGTLVKYIKQRLQDGEHPYPESYYAASANAVPPRPALQDEVETDVCVIGAGYTGLSSALFLLENGFRVTVLEAAKVGFGASGRNGGQIVNSYSRDIDVIERTVGPKQAQLLGRWPSKAGGSFVSAWPSTTSSAT
jgi:gamma-glutamylputrescine oxidase